MKKLILGLLLAVGVSGVSYARNSVGVKETTGSKVIKAWYFTLRESLFDVWSDDLLIDSCYHAYYTIIQDCDGNTISVYVGSNMGDCGGSQDGSVIIHNHREYVCTTAAQVHNAIEYGTWVP